MPRRMTFATSVAAIVMASAAPAQTAPPSYQADPYTYEVIFEDFNFRVIAATWKKGSTDKAHSHSLPFAVYTLNDCTLRIHYPDGTTRDFRNKAKTAFAGPITRSHTAENISETDCHAIFVELK